MAPASPAGPLRPVAVAHTFPFPARSPLIAAPGPDSTLLVAGRDETAGRVRCAVLSGDPDDTREPIALPLGWVNGMAARADGAAVVTGAALGSDDPTAVVVRDGSVISTANVPVDGTLESWPVPTPGEAGATVAWVEAGRLRVERLGDAAASLVDLAVAGTTSALAAGPGVVVRSRVGPDGLDAVMLSPPSGPQLVEMWDGQVVTPQAIVTDGEVVAVWVDRASGSVMSFRLGSRSARPVEVAGDSGVRAVTATHGALLWRIGVRPPAGEGENERVAAWAGEGVGPPTELGAAGVLPVVGWAGEVLVAVHGDRPSMSLFRT